MNYDVDNGEELIHQHNLNEKSIVVDLGSFQGDFSREMYERYKCRIFSFEPVDSFFIVQQKKISHINNINIYNFGLGKGDATVKIGLMGNNSSQYKDINDYKECKIRDFFTFINSYDIRKVDLLKINIERLCLQISNNTI